MTTAVPAMVRVAVRGVAVGFAATDTVTMLPPLPPVVFSVIHETGLLADHAHPAPVVTNTPAVPLPPPMLKDVGEIVYSQEPICVTVNDLPAIDTMPVRDVEAVCSAMPSDTVPEPVPLPPPVTAIHDADDVAVQEQLESAETLTDTVEGAAPTETLVLESVALHELAACVTVKPRPPIVSMPTRAKGAEFAVTEY